MAAGRRCFSTNADVCSIAQMPIPFPRRAV
jgi:hypothetical protein